MGIEIFLAYCMDLVLGDPGWMPHPVVGIGKAIEKTEGFLRRYIPIERLAGIVLLIFVAGSAYILTYLIVFLAKNINETLGMAVSAIIIFTCLSIKTLAKEAMGVLKALEDRNLDLARRRVSRIVGRDTENLDESEVIRANVETVAENTVDGVISPLFYAFIGGAPLAIAYKAVNTLDSMVGYKNERYRNFGWASARFDDLVNFIPARLARFLIAISAVFCRFKFRDALAISFRDGHKHPSPNSGIPEAAYAGALGVRLGGVNSYQGVVSEKPFIGDKKRELTLKDIKNAVKLMFVTSLVTLVFFYSVGIAILRFFVTLRMT